MAFHYLPLAVSFCFPASELRACQAVQFAQWFFAGLSKRFAWWRLVVRTMLSNSPFGYHTLTRHLYAEYIPSLGSNDCSPSPLSDKVAFASRVVEMAFPVLLFVPSARAAALVLAVCFHLLILLQCPLGAVQEWNVFNIAAALVLFNSQAHVDEQQYQHQEGVWGFFATGLRSIGMSMSATWLHPHLMWLYLLLSCFVLPVLGNLRCDLILPSILPGGGSALFRGARLSYLVAMRQYTGNWPRAYWLLRRSADHRLDAFLWRRRGQQQEAAATIASGPRYSGWRDWLATVWFNNELAFTHRLAEEHLDADEAYALPYKAVAFDAMQTLNGGALPDLLAAACSQQYLDGNGAKPRLTAKQRELKGLGVSVAGAPVPIPSGGALGASIPEAVLASEFDDHFCLPVSVLADLVLGETMGETNVVTPALLAEIQRRCHFERGELQLVSVDSFPLRGPLEAAWAIEDAARPQEIRSGWLFADESEYLMPPPKVNIDLEVPKPSKKRMRKRGSWEHGVQWMSPARGLRLSMTTSGWGPRREDRRGLPPLSDEGAPSWPALLRLLHTSQGPVAT
jgi:hypothetical protein